jgi:hypothetical protein
MSPPRTLLCEIALYVAPERRRQSRCMQEMHDPITTQSCKHSLAFIHLSQSTTRRGNVSPAQFNKWNREWSRAVGSLLALSLAQLPRAQDGQSATKRVASDVHVPAALTTGACVNGSEHRLSHRLVAAIEAIMDLQSCHPVNHLTQRFPQHLFNVGIVGCSAIKHRDVGYTAERICGSH